MISVDLGQRYKWVDPDSVTPPMPIFNLGVYETHYVLLIFFPYYYYDYFILTVKKPRIGEMKNFQADIEF